MKQVVTIGGGTGTFVVLSALRTIPKVSLSAIVTTADDGGSTGHLRDAYGFLPAGDARQALVALAEDGNVLRELFAYRFTKSDVAGHNLGNLFITALTDMLGSDSAALAEASRILRIHGKVIPVTESPSTLVATLADGTKVTTEKLIDERVGGRSPIASLAFLEPARLSSEAAAALAAADIIILGPGDLYTSSVAALLPSGMQEAIRDSHAKLVYVSNLFTKSGQTDHFTLCDHVNEIARYASREVDQILVHEGTFSSSVLAGYAEEGEYPVVDDMKKDQRVLRATLASVSIVPPLPNDPIKRSLIRHEPRRLAEAFLPLLG